MENFVQAEHEEAVPASLSHQAFGFFLHTVLGSRCLGAIDAHRPYHSSGPRGVPQIFVLLLSILVPLGAGFLVNQFRQDEMATLVWLVGLTWILIIALWVLDMPTGLGV